jgi:hypothetical protein
MAYTLEAKGTILTLGGALIGYKYSKQKSISTNSTGVEVIALADSLSVVIWARDLLTEFVDRKLRFSPKCAPSATILLTTLRVPPPMASTCQYLSRYTTWNGFSGANSGIP